MAKKNTAVATEVAEAEFTRFTEAMDLEFDLKGMDDEDRKGFIEARNHVMRALESATLVIDQHGQPVYTPVEGDTNAITFREPGGASFMAMDQKKQGHDVAKMYAMMAAMTGESIARFSGMKNRDLRVCRAVWMLFLG